MDKRTAAADSGKSDKEKKPNDKVMDNIWKLMKYTQGDNEQNKTMKLYMPVFIHIETLANKNESKEEPENKIKIDEEEEVEVQLLITLPPEYQFDQTKTDKEIPDPPKPNDPSITFEVIEEFKCYVRYLYFDSRSLFKFNLI